MKRLLALILASLSLCLSIFALSGCEKKIEGDFTFVAPDGAPALSIAKFIHDEENFGTDATFNYKVVSSTEINNAILKDKSDLIILPLNAATKLYNAVEDCNYQMISVVTHGNFYVMSKTALLSPSDLVGKVVFVPNPGKVPDWTFKVALKNNDLEYVVSDVPVENKVAIKYYNTPAEFNALLIQNASAVGLVPEPAVSVLKGKGVSVQLDLQKMYDPEKQAYPQAVLLARKDLVSEYPSLVQRIENAFPLNVSWVKENPQSAVNAVKGKFDATTLNANVINSSTIDGCKIFWQSAKDAKSDVSGYIQNIRSIDQTSSNLVNEGFFFNK